MTNDDETPLAKFLTYRAKYSLRDLAVLAPNTPREIGDAWFDSIRKSTGGAVGIPPGAQQGFEWFLEQERRGERRVIDVPRPAYSDGYTELLNLVAAVLESRHISSIKAALASIEVDAEWLITLEKSSPTTQSARTLGRFARAMETLGGSLGGGYDASQLLHRESVAALEEALRAVAAEQIRLFARDPTHLHSVTHRQFERVVAELLQSFGWDVELTQATRDGGTDIIAVSKDVDGSGLRTSFVVECKKYRPDRKIGIAVARQLLQVKAEKAVSHALIVTTSDFSEDAYKYAAKRWDLDLRAFEALAEWCREYARRPR
jgi:HJR/Mrr/RecB family endonuclease